MAECVVSAIMDTGNGCALVPACVVHCCHAPCPHDGEPANPAPLHAFTGNQTRDDAVRTWRQRTRRQRPLIIHTDLIPDPYDHVMEDETYPCPCGAEILPAGSGSDG